MRKLLIFGVAAIAALAFAGNAQAATSTSVSVYDDVQFGGTGFFVAFGQVFSRKDSCSANRKVKLVAKKNGKEKVLDVGRSSADGAISGGYLSDRAAGAALRFVAPKTTRCDSASAGVVEEMRSLAPQKRKATGTAVAVLGANGDKQNGAFAGLILLSQGSGKLRGMPVPKCFADRRVSLYGDGKVLDHGKTSRNGTWAQHLTLSESRSISEYKVKVGKATAPDGTKCAPGSTTFSISG